MADVDMMFDRLQPVSKKMQVVTALKDAIVSGKFRSGDQVVEGKLAQQFGVGQGLIREALIDLEHQGFVQRSPFSSTQVTELGNEDARDIFDVRIELEPLAFRLAGERAARKDVAHLRDLARKAREGADSGELDLFFEHHLEYRRKVWALSGNQYLIDALERLVVPLYALYLMQADFNREGLVDTVRDCISHQEQTLRAFESRESAEAAEIARGFLRRMKDSLGSRLLPTGKSDRSAGQPQA